MTIAQRMTYAQRDLRAALDELQSALQQRENEAYQDIQDFQQMHGDSMPEELDYLGGVFRAYASASEHLAALSSMHQANMNVLTETLRNLQDADEEVTL